MRTINIRKSAEDYSLRLRGIAQALHNDYPQQIGLIGMQELRNEKMTDCLQGKLNTNAAECLAAELTSLYGQSAEGILSDSNWFQLNAEVLGIIVDNNWEILDRKSWNIGDNRVLIEVFLMHRKKSYQLRFYNTHFTLNAPVSWFEKLLYGDNLKRERGMKIRSHQAAQVIEVVRKRAQPGELPPIIVGDFNAGRNFVTEETEESVKKMEKHFLRLIDNFGTFCTDYTVIDHVYIGKKESFPKSRGSFEVINWHRIYMDERPVYIDGRHLEELTDHNVEGFTLKILEK